MMSKTNRKMPVILGVILGGIFIFLGGFMMWYFPWKQSQENTANQLVTGTVQKKILTNISAPLLGIGTAIFKVGSPTPIPLYTDGKSQYPHILEVPDEEGNGENILTTWLENNEIKITLSIYDKNRNLISFINANNWTVNKSEIVDCNYDGSNYEVVENHNGKFVVILQIQMLPDKVQIGFKTYLKNKKPFFIGNNFVVFDDDHPYITESLKPIFVYPSKGNFGKKA